MSPNEIQNLLDSLYSKADYDLMFERTSKSEELFNTIWEMIKKMPEKKSWRLMWILDHASEKKNDFLLPIRNEIYEYVLKTNNESFIRHGMKLILRCPINEDYAGELLDRCIEWMHNPKAKMSSQGLGLEFFYQLCKIYPEMAPELIAHIDDIEEKSTSPGYSFRLKKIRSELQ